MWMIATGVITIGKVQQIGWEIVFALHQEYLATNNVRHLWFDSAYCNYNSMIDRLHYDLLRIPLVQTLSLQYHLSYESPTLSAANYRNTDQLNVSI